MAKRGRVVPDHPALGRAVIIGRDFVVHFGVRLERAEAVQVASGNSKLPPVLGAEFHTGVLADGYYQ